jgi:hypothetical protein
MRALTFGLVPGFLLLDSIVAILRGWIPSSRTDTTIVVSQTVWGRLIELCSYLHHFELKTSA